MEKKKEKGKKKNAAGREEARERKRERKRTFKENHVSPRNRFMRTGHVFRLGLIAGTLGASCLASRRPNGRALLQQMVVVIAAASDEHLPSSSDGYPNIPMSVSFAVMHSLCHRLFRFRDLSPSILRYRPLLGKKKIIILTRKINTYDKL